MEKITNYVISENLNSLYKNEASSTIGLARDVAEKLNEVIDYVNNMSKDDLAWKQTQEGTIRKAIVYLKDNLVNTIDKMYNIIQQQGFIDNRLKAHTQTLSSRIDVLLGSLQTGSTTMDAEVIDARVGQDGTSYKNLGDSIRSQFNNIIPEICLLYGVDYNTTTGVITLKDTPNNVGSILYILPKNNKTIVSGATIQTGTATYPIGNSRPHVVSLNIVGAIAKIKCVAQNTYTYEDGDINLFVIYNNKVYPCGVSPESLTINELEYIGHPNNVKKAHSHVVSLNGGLVIDHKNNTVTIKPGFYVSPIDVTGAFQIEEQTIAFENSSVLYYLVLGVDKKIKIVNRNHTFIRGEYCLCCIFEGQFIPVELDIDSINHASNGRGEISENTLITINDAISLLGDRSHQTKIVLAGDSITHGVGGTGWAQSGDTIITVGDREYKRSDRSVSWANMFKEYIENNYNAVVINNGCTGTGSEFWNSYKETLIPNDTDIVILTIGTNDRNTKTGVTTATQAMNTYYNNITNIVEYCHANGIHIVLVTPSPATATNEAESGRIIGIPQINVVISKVASEHNMEFADTHSVIYTFCMFGGTSLEALLPDGLHPNDVMYTMMFNAIMNQLHLSFPGSKFGGA